MAKIKHTIFNLLIILISFLCINGEKFKLPINNSVQVLISHGHVNDIEVPDQQHNVSFNDYEKWVGSFGFDFSDYNQTTVKLLVTVNFPSEDFANSIWQPPKSV